MFLDGSIEPAQHKFESEMQARLLDVAGIIRRHPTADCLGVSIEQPFGRNAKSLQVLYTMMGAAALAAVEAGLSVTLVNLVKLKMHATGKGNAKKPDMQAAAKARWDKDLGKDEADAGWAGAYALDNSLF
ncbi:crossover junction endodeoxyribonuclease RuvC [Bradyrhizobium sp. NC92]|uniref:crossover junction endodeoxyribonuclease RuvC n=1 Tax=Bradyrhizobium sp. (strain NC92) TaxID=55395 RepID=UPI0021A9F776|nr:crossover junction endodeoxyribonuclease RuvC [Bradyrhizobium sp. NC92]UWU66113.1 crossover junction endodeoxyribonuclease RuvC [Bradyrhizobium sp. NC92]